MKTLGITLSILGAISVAGTPLLLLPRIAHAATELFSAQDVDNWNKALPEAKPKFKNGDQNTRGAEADAGTSCHAIPKGDAPPSPTIDIVSPVLDKPLAAPLDISVKFSATDSDGIQPATFKLCYLAHFITVDITDKIADKVTISPEGLHVAGAALPSGHHHLVMLIEDKGGHVGRREATFDIQ
jgi:hypothetical protein